MPERVTGSYARSIVAGDAVEAFVPFDLPPSRPALVISDQLADRLRTA